MAAMSEAILINRRSRMFDSTRMGGPTILVLGTSGLVGSYVARALKGARLRVSSRDPRRVEALRAAGRDAVLLDLDDPATFPAALHGVDRLNLVTGHTVAMLAHKNKIRVLLIWRPWLRYQGRLHRPCC
jgi:NAD(P)-dependent dehydrogenase (short-subunit alcohol dehydrogenase family)